MRRLTNRILESIIEMAGMIEADGWDQMQGYMTDKERERAFTSALNAGLWASDVLRKRSRKSRHTEQLRDRTATTTPIED